MTRSTYVQILTLRRLCVGLVSLTATGTSLSGTISPSSTAKLGMLKIRRILANRDSGAGIMGIPMGLHSRNGPRLAKDRRVAAAGVDTKPYSR